MPFTFGVTPQDAVDAMYRSGTVECLAEEYPPIRAALLRKAGKWAEWGYPNLAQRARDEIKRLDLQFPGGT